MLGMTQCGGIDVSRRHLFDSERDERSDNPVDYESTKSASEACHRAGTLTRKTQSFTRI